MYCTARLGDLECILMVGPDGKHKGLHYAGGENYFTVERPRGVAKPQKNTAKYKR